MRQLLPARITLARRRSLLPLPLASAAAAIALLASGCGGPSPEERFAESVCSTILPRAQEMLETYDDVIHKRAAPGPDARVSLWAFALRGTEITTRLRAEVGALSVPDTDAGRRAASYVEHFARLAFETTAAEERRVRKLPKSITLLQSIRGLDRLELALFSAYAEMTSYDFIGVRIPELKEPLEKADSCKELNALQAD